VGGIGRAALRARPGSNPVLAKASRHQADGAPTGERQRAPVEVFPVSAQPPASVQPSDGMLDDPALWQHPAFACLAALNDLDILRATDPGKTLTELRPLIPASARSLSRTGYVPNRMAISNAAHHPPRNLQRHPPPRPGTQDPPGRGTRRGYVASQGTAKAEEARALPWTRQGQSPWNLYLKPTRNVVTKPRVVGERLE